MTKNNRPKQHVVALKNLYKEHGVGRTYKQKHSFWKQLYPNTYISHFDEDDDVIRTKCFELYWLVDSFPQDFHHC